MAFTGDALSIPFLMGLVGSSYSYAVMWLLVADLAGGNAHQALYVKRFGAGLVPGLGLLALASVSVTALRYTALLVIVQLSVAFGCSLRVLTSQICEVKRLDHWFALPRGPEDHRYGPTTYLE